MRPMQTLPAIEGLTPSILWITLFGLVCIGSLVILGDKVMDVFRKRKQRKADQAASKDGTIQGQLDKISKKLDDIDEFMKETNRRFDRDKRRIDSLEEQNSRVQEGINVLCRSQLAHLNNAISGNHVDGLKETRAEIVRYLTSTHIEKGEDL